MGARSGFRTSVPTFCGKDCGGDACPLVVEIEGGRIRRVRNNPAAGPRLSGCARALDLSRMQEAPGRLTAPLLREGPRGSGRYREIAWDEALALAARRLGEIRATRGADSILAMGSAGCTGALHGTVALTRRFLNATGGSTVLSGSYSNGAARFVLPYLLGPGWKNSGMDPATLRHSSMILLWGANILDTRFGSELPGRLMEAKERGAEIVVIDPWRNSTVRRAATRWIPCRPGTDAALMLALLHVLFSENLADRDFARERSLGFDELEASVLGEGGDGERSPEWAEAITGVPAAETRRLARDWATRGPVLLFPGYSIQRAYAGEEPYRLAVALQLATGNFGRLGGSTGSMPNRLPKPRVGSLAELGRGGGPWVPVNRWPDAILEGRSGGYPTDIAAAWVAGANYLNQGSDLRKSVRAFEALEFSVCNELFLTPTARYCDLVLPVASPLEKADIGIPWAGNYLLYKRAALPPPGQARSDFAIFAELAERLGHGRAFSEGKDEAAWIEGFLDESDIADRDAFMESGVWFGADQERVGLADFAADPRGHPLGTPSGRVELLCLPLERETGLPALPSWRVPTPDPAFPLSLISPKAPGRTHSQGGWEEVEAADREPFVLVHPDDAAVRGLADGELARVRSATGSLVALARCSSDLMRGCVAIHEGTWALLPAPEGDGRGSPNFLTSSEGSPGSLACVMHALGVEVERA